MTPSYWKGSAAALLFSAVAYFSFVRNATAFSSVMSGALNRCRSSVGFAMTTTIRMYQPSPAVVGIAWTCRLGFSSRRNWTLKVKEDEMADSEVDEVTESGLHSNIYQPWSIAEDYYLYKFQKDPIPKLASKLGRGLVGVRTRLQKLNDVKSQAYERLFTSSGKQKQILASLLTSGKADVSLADMTFGSYHSSGAPSSASSSSDQHKLTAVREVLRRIQWDVTLTPSDFSVCYYDRVADNVQSVPFTQPNTSVEGQSELLVLAIPEHRIVSVSYKDRLVWDKSTRLDYICGSGKRDDDDTATTIHDVIETYSEWQRLQHEIKEQRLLRQRTAVQRVKEILGEERYQTLRQSSDELRKMYGGLFDETKEHKLGQIRAYVRASFLLFEQARKESIGTTSTSTDSTDYENKHPLSSTEEVFSELVSTLDDVALRNNILLEITNVASQCYNRKLASEPPPPVIQLREEDLTETFTKGGGAGGQKINKTSNRVILTHNPTQISVSVQETRSLQQNRKIARKRLLEKVDLYMHGSNSKFAIRAMKDAENKNKAKARSRAKYKKRLGTNLEQKSSDEEGPELMD